MQKTLITSICIVLFSTTLVSQDQGVAPKIISTIPEFGDCNVDPGLREIILKFDQDMSPGMSLLNTRNMPESNGQTKWIDQRTFSIPVKLSSNRLYSLTFNNWKYPNFRNFQSIKGIPLNPDELHFRTKVVSSEPLNKKAFRELQEFFPEQYSYASIKGIDWKALLEEYRFKLENSESTIEFALKLVKLLKKADDPHLWVETEGQRFNTNAMKAISINYNTNEIVTKLTNRKDSEMGIVISGEYNDIGYILIRNWESNNKESILTCIDRLNELKNKPYLIIDVRENSGGDESIAEEIASYFINDSSVYEKVNCYNKETGEFDKQFLKVIYPNNDGFRYSGVIYVLSGPAVLSSNESFILMMKQVPNALVVGMRTYGSSGNPLAFELSNGVTVYLPSWQAYTVDGQMIEGRGIDPDIELNTTEKDFENKDGVFDEVLKLIESDE